MTDEKLTTEDDVEGDGRAHTKQEEQTAKDVQAHVDEGEDSSDDVVAHTVLKDPERKVL